MTTNRTTAPPPIARPKSDQQVLAESIAEVLNASREQQPEPERVESAAAAWRAAELDWIQGVTA